MNFINNIIRFSLKNRLTILLGAVLLIVGGIISTQKMDIDVFPDLTAPTVVVMTDAHGMAAEEVERLVTFPVETAVNGATNVRRVRSASLQGFSFVWAEFNWGTDIFKARQIVSEKMVSLAGTLPSGITPVLAPQSSIMGEILLIGLQADSTSMMDLRTLADWVIKPAILATGGVSQVTNIGGELKQFQILADPQKMDAYGVNISDLERVGCSFSNNSVGGVVRDFGNEYALRGMARTTDIEQLGRSLVRQVVDGKPVVLSDVAEVRVGHAVPMGSASQNARPAVILAVSKQPNINTLSVTEKIEANLKEIQKSLPPDVRMDTHIFRQADFIESSVSNVERSLFEGALFAVVILILFLASYRTTLISVIAIPLSLLGSCIVLHLLGMNINTMTLGGMCIAIGSLVDDAIIDVENVYKRLRQNHSLPPEERMPVVEVVYEASKEIRASILNATFIIIVAFIPLFFLTGMEGRMLKPLGTAYIISLFMSLVVAMTVTPLLCRMMLSDDKYLSRNEKESWVASRLSRLYGRSLNWVLGHRRTVVGVTLGCFVLSVVLFFTMGRSFLPEFNEGSAVISAIAKPGVSLEVSDSLGNMMERALMQVPEVTSTARRTGRGELDEHSQTSNSAELDVQFTLDGRSREEVFNDMREKLAGVPGISVTIGQPLGHRIDHMLSGTRANIAIKVFGTDLNRMYMIGNQIKNSIEGIEGLVDVNVEQQVETPQLQVRANRNALAAYGISIDDFNRFVEMAFAGEKISDIYEGQRKFDVVLRLDRNYTDNIDGVRKALIDTGDGRKVPLEEVADIVSVGGPNVITRENVQRKLVVAANVSGRDLGSVVSDIQKTVSEQVQLPEGYRVEYGGQFENAQNASRNLFITTLLALVVIFFLLYGEFRNVSLAALVLLNLPFALIGGVLAVWLSSATISIPTIIGFITLFGIATRNGILLVSRYQHLQQQGKSLGETVFNGSIDRLNPIIMTALTSALALIPLVFNGDKSGNEIQSPMALVVLGGLLTSTLLNVYVMPVVYAWYAGRKHSSKGSRSMRIPLVILFMCCFSVASAQDIYQPVLSSIEKNSTTLNAARQQMEAEQIGNRTGLTPSNPEVEYGYLWGSPSGIGARQDITVRQSLDFPSVYVRKSQLADRQNASAQLQYNSVRQELLLEAKSLCIQVVYCNALLRLYERQLANVQQIATAQQRLLQTGEANQMECNKAMLSLANTQSEISRITIERNALMSRLTQLNGGVPLSFDETEYPVILLPNDFQSWYADVEQRYPALQYLRSQVEVAEGELRLTKSSWFPKLSVGYKGEFFAGQNHQGVTVGISIPLWENKDRVRHAKAQVEASQMMVEDLRTSYYQHLQNLHTQALQQHHNVQQLTLALQKNNSLDLLLKSYQYGEISLLQYLLEVEYLFLSNDRCLQAQRDLQLTLAELTSAML